MNTTRLPLLVALAAAVPALAETAAPAAKTYGPFFAPVAIEDRRAISCDRPNAASSPYSVNSGVVQVEVAALSFTHDTVNGDKDFTYNSYSLGSTMVRLGLRDNLELRIAGTPFTYARANFHGSVSRDSGFGDTVISSRYNIQGNDGKGLGVAILPSIKLPSNQSDTGLFGNRKIEGSVEVPLGYALNDKTSLVANPGVAFDNNDNSDGRDWNPYMAVAISRTLTDKLSVYGELYGKKNTGRGEYATIVTAHIQHICLEVMVN